MVDDGLSKVGFSALDAGAAQLKGTFTQLQTALSDLESQLSPMVSTWNGDAREAYFQQKQKWNEAAQSMAQILGQMGGAVETANSNYRAAEGANLSRWS